MPRIVDAPTGMLALAVVVWATAGAPGCYLPVDSANERDATPASPSVDPRSPGTTFGTGGTYDLGGDPGARGGSGAGQAPVPVAPPPPATCPAVAVSRFNELMIIDPGVTNDARASNQAASRPWSFRQRLEALVDGATEAAATAADAWLAGWSGLTDVPVSTTPGAARVPIEPRPDAQDVLRCPWLRQSPENGCDTTCAACRTRHVDLARAPFRLLAIVNRTDLATSAACGTNGGELRFVYGAADPNTLRALPFTVIFEYGITLRLGETLRDWGAAWHQLGALAVGSAAYNARLDDVVSQALARATLRRVLTNENAFGSGLPWEMRQFVPALTDSGTVRLVAVAMSGTPRLTLAQSPELGQWIDDNASAVLANDNPLPASMLAASAPIPSSDFAWRTTARNADAASAFNRNTCNGCHGGRSSSRDVRFQHVAPPTDAVYGPSTSTFTAARLSLFLHNPGYDDELGHRERKLAALLCTPCGSSGGY